MPSIVRLPVLPLRDVVAFPLMTLPLLVGRPKSLKACEAALAGNGRILLVAQRDAVTEDPSADDLYGIGVIAVLAQHLSLPNSRMKLLVRGEQRARLMRLTEGEGVLTADAQAIGDPQVEAAMSGPPGFSLADWTAEGPAGVGSQAQARIVDLQRLLEDEALGPVERMTAARALFG
jgi:ATP-dependent Lon protease